MTRNTFLVFFLFFSAIAVFTGCGPSAYDKELSEELGTHIELIQKNQPVIEGVQIFNIDVLINLYKKDAKLLSARWESWENIDQLIFAIRNSYKEGLQPQDYHLEAIENLVENITGNEYTVPGNIAKMEMLLTDAFLMLSAHMAGGKTDAETISPQWNAAGKRIEYNWDDFIDGALQNEQIIENLQMLTPRHREYINLKNALSKYLQLKNKGGWGYFTTILPKIEKGLRHPDVARLRDRLAITQGNIDLIVVDQDLFDQSLHDNVVLFQRRNGLTADGVVGRATIEALNIPVDDRIASIRVNLERWRWLSEDLGDQYIKVNIANYELQAIENDRIVFQSDAIVGRPFRSTPVFSSLITYLVLNPDWIVPPTILFNDVVPAVRANPGYLAEKRMKVLRTDGSEVDPVSVDWYNVTRENFPYRIRQEPGPENALGRVKFMFPNQYNVYIHDTPSRNLFLHTDRSFSSGCIRINKPLEFAAYLLKDNPVWTPELIKNIVDQGRERTVNLPNPVPVHILYLTAWADDDGMVYFRKDIYKHDTRLLTALAQPPLKPDE